MIKRTFPHVFLVLISFYRWVSANYDKIKNTCKEAKKPKKKTYFLGLFLGQIAR